MECRSSEEIYREELQKPVISCIRTTFVTFIIVATAISLCAYTEQNNQKLQTLRHNQDINLKTQKIKLAYQLGKIYSFLNRTDQASLNPHSIIPDYCQKYAVCSSPSLESPLSQLYFYQQAMMLPHPTFFYNQTENSITILTYNKSNFSTAAQSILSDNRLREKLKNISLVIDTTYNTFVQLVSNQSIIICLFSDFTISCVVAPIPQTNTLLVTNPEYPLNGKYTLSDYLDTFVGNNNREWKQYYMNAFPSNAFVYDDRPSLSQMPTIVTTQSITIPSQYNNPYPLFMVRIVKGNEDLSSKVLTITQLVSYSTLIFAFSHLFYLAMRLVHRYKFVIPCRDLTSNTPQHEKLEQISKRYRWANQPQLVQGIEIFRDSQMWNIQQYILRELILRKDSKIEYYDMLIELKLRHMKENSQLADMDRVEEVYKLEIQKIQKFRGTTQQANEKCQRLEHYQEMFAISQELLDLAAVTVFQAKARCGRPVPYKKLLQLQKSQCEETQAKAYFLAALEYLKNPSYDVHAVQQLCHALADCKTLSVFKRQCLLKLLTIVSKYNLGKSHQKNILDMARYYNHQDKRITIIIDSLEGIDDKLVNELLAKMMGYFNKDDTVQIVDVHGLNRNSIRIKMSQVNPQQMLKEYLYQLSDDYEGSRKSRSGFEAIMHHLQKVTVVQGQYSPYLVLIMSDITLNDVRSEKQSFKKVFSQNFEMSNRFVHLVLIGNYIKAETFQKSKLVKSLREVYSFLQIDLKIFDDESTAEDLEAFFRNS